MRNERKSSEISSITLYDYQIISCMVFPVNDCHKKKRKIHHFYMKSIGKYHMKKRKPLFEKYILFRNVSYIIKKRTCFILLTFITKYEFCITEIKK